MLLKKMYSTAIVLILFSIIGCKTNNIPGSSLSDVEFVIFPHILKKNEIYYLEYQLKSTKQANTAPLVRLLGSKIVGEKAYYFFSSPISHIDFGVIVERDVSIDGFTDYAKKDSIYWLNSDKSEIKLKIE